MPSCIFDLRNSPDQEVLNLCKRNKDHKHKNFEYIPKFKFIHGDLFEIKSEMLLKVGEEGDKTYYPIDLDKGTQNWLEKFYGKDYFHMVAFDFQTLFDWFKFYSNKFFGLNLKPVFVVKAYAIGLIKEENIKGKGIFMAWGFSDGAMESIKGGSQAYFIRDEDMEKWKEDYKLNRIGT